MVTAISVASPLPQAGVLLAAMATVMLFFLRTARAQAAAMSVVLTLAPLLLVAEVIEAQQLSSLREHARLLITVILLTALLIAALGLLFYRRPGLFPYFAIFAIPFRLPLSIGETSANLLLPLYVVVGAGCLAYIAGRLRRPPSDELNGGWGWLELTIAAALALYALQSLYSPLFTRALDNIVFFYIPFALLFKLLLTVRWSARKAAICGAIVVGLAVIFTGIGFWEYQARHLFWNSSVIDTNQFASYFRVNSAFFDPNIFGRYLTVAMLIVVSVMLWELRRRLYPGLFIIVFILWGGLLISFSQSSMGALLVGLGVLAAMRWSVRWAAAAAGVLVVLGLALAVTFHSSINLRLDKFRSVDRATSGRLNLVAGGLDLFASRPIWGYGSGSFSLEYQKQRKASSQTAATASHTTPVTVMAEQGLPGLIIYIALLAASFTVVFGRPRAPPNGQVRGYFATRAALAASYTAILFHTLVYAAFIEDPMVWALLAAALALKRQGRFDGDEVAVSV